MSGTERGSVNSSAKWYRELFPVRQRRSVPRVSTSGLPRSAFRAARWTHSDCYAREGLRGLQCPGATKILSLVIRRWLDLFNYQGARTTPLKDPAAGGNLLPSKRQQPFVLP